MSERTLFVKIFNHFGRTSIYPACAQSQLFVELLNQKTFTESDIEIIKKLGYEIKTQEVKL